MRSAGRAAACAPSAGYIIALTQMPAKITAFFLSISTDKYVILLLTLRHEIQNSSYLLVRRVELLYDFVDGQILEGKRVPRNTQAPPTFPGILSTAEHCDQSSIDISALRNALL